MNCLKRISGSWPERGKFSVSVSAIPCCRGVYWFPGKLVSLEDTIAGFEGILNGEYDHLPEAAFYLVGTIEEFTRKARN